MGLSCKQVCSDGLDWSECETRLQQPQTLELPKPVIGRRQHQHQHQHQQNQQQSEPLNCPRCDSTNTKFCYYNNYNKSQPRHFCKSCKRHWTKGGTLRNVPVGGGRKNKRLKKTSKSANSTSNINRNMINKVNQKEPSSVLHHNSISCNNSVSKSFNTGNNGVVLASTLSLPQNHFPSSNSKSKSNSSSFETKPSLISTCFQNSNVYNYSSGETMEDSIITTIMPTSSTTSINHHQQWQVPNASRGMEMTSYWNWDDLDNFVSTSDLNIMPWDHNSELKP